MDGGDVFALASAAEARVQALARMGMDDPDECGDGFQLLDVIEALSTHFHEHQAAILRWPFKLFCVKWRRMTVQLAKRDAERERDKRRAEAEREQQDAERGLRQMHAAQWGE